MSLLRPQDPRSVTDVRLTDKQEALALAFQNLAIHPDNLGTIAPLYARMAVQASSKPDLLKGVIDALNAFK